MTVSTLLFNGIDLADYVIVNDISGVYAPMTRRGSHDTIPRRDGQNGAQLPFDAFQFSIPVTVGGDTEADMHDMLFQLGAVLLGTGGLGMLTRRLASNGGSGYTDYTANGACGGMTGFVRLEDETLQCSLLFTNLDGGWKRASDSVMVRP